MAAALRQHFQDQLATIKADVIRMGGWANDMVRQAVEATLNGDSDHARAVIEADDKVDAAERSVFHQTILTVMRESPVAADLRLLIGTMGVVGEIEKVADDAVKLARRATRLSGQFPQELKVALLEMGEQARRSFSLAVRLYSEYDPAIRREVVDMDKDIDSLYKKARDRVFELIQQNPSATEALVRTIETFHALEHVADHAVAIACRLQMVYESEACNHSSAS